MFAVDANAFDFGNRAGIEVGREHGPHEERGKIAVACHNDTNNLGAFLGHAGDGDDGALDAAALVYHLGADEDALCRVHVKHPELVVIVAQFLAEAGHDGRHVLEFGAFEQEGNFPR